MSKPNSPRAEEQGESKRMRPDGPSISGTFGSASIEVDGIPVTITGFREMEPEMRAIFVECKFYQFPFFLFFQLFG